MIIGITLTAPILLTEVVEDHLGTPIIMTPMQQAITGIMEGSEEEHALKETLLNSLKAIKKKLWNFSQPSSNS